MQGSTNGRDRGRPAGYGPPDIGPVQGLDTSLKWVTFQVQSASRDGIIENRYGLRAACLDDAGPC
jgi:hypothetical protein